jgi:hypothetical protein
MTQQSFLTAIDGDDVAHFSHPFALDLYFDINRLDKVFLNSSFMATLQKSCYICEQKTMLYLILAIRENAVVIKAKGAYNNFYKCYKHFILKWIHFQHGKSNSNFHLPKWPQIFVEVISLDSWMRCRTEGYGFSPLPLNTGLYNNINVCTWMPILDGPTTEMR